MGDRRLAFVDWMKCFGISIIVYGHVAGSTINAYTSPIEAKQLGVACFLFVVGYTLAQERRRAVEVVVRRLFTLYVVGLAAALVLTVLSLVTANGAKLGNFLPFALGANVLMLQDGFPANPTTWYIATYIHVILLYVLLRNRFSLRLWMLPVALVAEIVLRIVFVRAIGPFFAYMALTNWLGALLWGALQGQRAETGASRPHWSGGIAVLAGLTALSLAVSGPMLAHPGFPFDTLVPGAPLAAALVASIATSAAYLGCPDALFRLTQTVPAPAIVRCFARNTLVIFIGHMPLFYFLEAHLGISDFWISRGIELLICLPGLALLSEAIMRVLQPETLRTRFMAVIDQVQRPSQRLPATDQASTGHAID
jgi:fucose 4-O-acetylase-like acetyltransferase